MVQRNLIVILITVLSCFGSTLVKGKASVQVPSPIQQRLDSLYPGQKDVQWTKMNRRYRADFIYSGYNVSITFQKDARILLGMEEIDFNSLPPVITEKVQKDYGLYKVLMVTKEFKRDREFYEIEIVKGKYHYMLSYNQYGFLTGKCEVIKNDVQVLTVN